jgi:hypothetical protein
VKPNLFTRFRWWLDDLRGGQDAKVVAGLLVLAVLVTGGFLTARAVADASSPSSTEPSVRIVTTRQKVRVRVHGHLVTRWRVRKVYARPHTVMQTQTIRTPNGTRVVTHPVTRYRVVYHKRVVKVNGKTRTELQPVTNTKTLNNTKTELVTVTHQHTSTQVETVTRPVTVVTTTTVVSTETDTVPITITVTLPLP